MLINYRARRALDRQLAYQQAKAASLRGNEIQLIPSLKLASRNARSALEKVRPIGAESRVLEVGSGAHGLIFFFGTEYAIGIDPLAAHYATLFPVWQSRAITIAAYGERLPFASSSFDIVLCDNVVDHAQSPAAIVAEIARVLSPGGLVYFTVNVHHPLYAVASSLHATWNAMGFHYEITPFADHTVHLTLDVARKLVQSSKLRILQESNDIAATSKRAASIVPRHFGDRLKRLFFKNAQYCVIATKQ